MLGFCIPDTQVTSLNHQASWRLELSKHVAIPVAKELT